MEILTLAPGFDAAARTQQLQTDGLISHRVRLRNLWNEISESDDTQLAALSYHDVSVNGDDALRAPSTVNLQHELAGAAGQIVQTTRYRADGSVFATDRRDVDEAGTIGGRRITIYSAQGDAIGSWSTATGLYTAWLDFVVGDTDSTIICDSAFVGGLIARHESEKSNYVQVIHSHHLDREEEYFNDVSKGKLPVLIDSDCFNAITTLTERQYQDFNQSGIASDNFAAIPNTFKGEYAAIIDSRPRHLGVIVARLSGIKQIDHAIRAVGAVQGSPAPHVDICGVGDLQTKLENMVDRLACSDRVTFHGFDPNARARFADSSFSMLTSKAEGHPLVLLESMASGCIPIAYDIEYGPSDIITDGIDGFLVPANDVDGMVAAIQRFLNLEEAEVVRMREAAIRRARDFSPEEIMKLWGDLLHSLSAPKFGRWCTQASAKLVEVRRTEQGFDLAVEVSGITQAEAAWFKLTCVGRKRDSFGRSSTTASVEGDRLLVTGALPDSHSCLGRSELLDLYVDARVCGRPIRIRVDAGDVRLPFSGSVLQLYPTKHENVSLRLLTIES